MLKTFLLEIFMSKFNSKIVTLADTVYPEINFKVF